MGLIDPKEKIIDFQLTDKGRDLLSQNNLNFSYYSFSDDGIDYSGSLSSSIQISGSNLDNYVHINTFAFEPIRKNDKSINNFLYTVSLGSEVSSQFNSSITGSLTLNRNYSIDKIENIVKSPEAVDKMMSQDNVLDYVIVVEETNIVQANVQRTQNYIQEQLKNLLKDK